MSQDYKILSISASTNGGITDIETSYVSTTGITVNFTSISATTISGGTLYGNGSNLTNIGNTFTGGTIAGATIFTNGLTANTFSATSISATTYVGLPQDVYTTGTTRNDDTVYYNRNNGLSAYTSDAGLSTANNRLLINDSSTGVISFDGLSFTASATTYSVGAIKGWFVDTTSDSVNPTKQYVEFSATSGNTLINLSGQNVTYIAVNSGGTLTEQGSPFTPTQTRSLIHLGVIVHSNRTFINAINNQVSVNLSPASQLSDLIEGIGFFNISGNKITANGANLNINKSSGYVFKEGINFVSDNKSPHTLLLTGLTAPSNIRYRLQNGDESLNTAVIDPNNYDFGGVLTDVPTNKFQIQRIYIFQSNLIRIQYGQATYVSMSEAIQAISTESFVIEQNILENGLFRGLLIVKDGTTVLTDSTKALFIESSKFGSAAGLGSTSVSTLQQAYDNSVTPEIVTNSTLGAVSIKRGSGADTDNIFKGLNGAGNITSFVRGDGAISGASVSATTIYSNNYLGLPTDVNVTGGTYSNGIATFSNNTGGTFNVSGFSTTQDTYVTGFTYNNSNKFTIANSTGGTFSATINSMTGLTVNGDASITGTTTYGTAIGTLIVATVGAITTLATTTLSTNTLTVNGNATVTGSTNVKGLTATTFSATTANIGTILSGGTDLYSIFLTTNDGNDITRVQPGTNTFTAGTENNPTVNVTALTISTLIVSGNTNLQELIATNFSATTLSGGTIYSGSTPLETIITNLSNGDITRVQPGTNISTGGTANFPTINLDSSILLSSVSATTISGATIYGNGSNLTGMPWVSGSTGIYSIKTNNGTTISTGNYAVAQGNLTSASGDTSHAEGFTTTAVGQYSHSEGHTTTASGTGSHAQNRQTYASGLTSHAEGYLSTSIGASAHAEGRQTTAIGDYSHSQGYSTTADGINGSHSEGYLTISSGGYGSHAEGYASTANGYTSHAEGQGTIALGTTSHAGGYNSKASGTTSFVHGENSVAGGSGTTVLGNNITGLTNNTTYVNAFNIKSIGSGTPVITLGIDSVGNVVTGTTGSSSRVTGTLETTGATQTTLSTINTLTSSSTHVIEAFITAKGSANIQYGSWKRTLVVNYFGGVVTIPHENADLDYQTTGFTTSPIGFSVSGTNVLIQVTGITSTNIQWNSTYDIVTKSTN